MELRRVMKSKEWGWTRQEQGLWAEERRGLLEKDTGPLITAYGSVLVQALGGDRMAEWAVALLQGHVWKERTAPTR